MGRHVIADLIKASHDVTCVTRRPESFKLLPWADRVSIVLHDIESDVSPRVVDQFDAIMHLAWSRLDNYADREHELVALPRHLAFLKHALECGTKRILVAGTCLEYGLLEGCLAEHLPVAPCTAYGIAKDLLRRNLEPIADRLGVDLQWTRLFYLHGPGQSERSLLSQLDAAIDRNQNSFPMSPGDQVRDYMPVDWAARKLVRLVERPTARGIYNICSGVPVTVLELVKQRIRDRHAAIALNLGVFPYPPHEPRAFWGDSRKYVAEVERE